ncbi:MFS transporter [Hydrogenophaga sp.]|uniref:MFS transporter n=1 Tax=Hydrogenophaga sp. TaxID=1904254 RepID=UPI0035ADE22C
MARQPADVLNPGVRRREVFAWAMYDFANSGYTTVVLTAVFSAYFVGVVADGAPWATFAWTASLSLSYAIVMLSMPFLGAWADRRAAKKRLLALSTVGCVLTTAALSQVGPGAVVLGIVLIVLSNVFYSWGESLVAAFLPELAQPQALGRVSGWGWSFGYLGGMLALGLSLMVVLRDKAAGLSAAQFVPKTMWITAVVFGVSALVTFVWLKERARPLTEEGAGGSGKAWRQLNATFREARRYRDFMWLMACAVAYQAGVAVTIALAAIYAEQVIGFAQQETMVLIFVLNIAAALGAFVFGHWQDRIGHRRALGLTLAGWVLTCVIAAVTTTKGGFWYAAAIAGVCMGSSQSAGRALAGLFAPPAQLAEFYGLWTFAIRLASIVGPLTYGLITWGTGGNQRLAILATAGMFVAGWVLLQKVDVERGRQAAITAS